MPTNCHEFLEKFLSFHAFSVLSLFVFLILVHKLTSLKSGTIKNPPPSPPRLPIIGNLHQLGTYPHRTLRTLSKKYGDLMLLHLGSKPTIVVSSAGVASQVLKTHDVIFASRPNLSVSRRLFGNGKDIFSSSYGEYWRQLRSLCVMQMLSVKRVRSFRSVREEEVALMISKIRGVKMVDLSEMFISLSTGVISMVAFGKKYEGEKLGGFDFNKLLDGLGELLGGFFVGDFISRLSWIGRFNGVDSKVNEVTSGFDYFFERVLEEHSARTREDHDREEEDEMVMSDFVDVLLQAQRGDGSGNFCLDKETIKAVILDMFAGASDTSRVLLEWIMSELLKNRRIMRELQKEVTTIVGDKETVSEDDLENMKYLKAVIKETLRLHPVTPLMPPHESTEDVKINGYDISAGTMLIVNIYAIGRDPMYWDEPESFYPERFLDSPIDFKGQDFQFIPFGSGRRSCPGMSFAMATIEFVIANLVHRFDWALPNGVSGEFLDMMEAQGMAAHRQNPLLAIPTPRI